MFETTGSEKQKIVEKRAGSNCSETSRPLGDATGDMGHSRARSNVERGQFTPFFVCNLSNAVPPLLQ